MDTSFITINTHSSIRIDGGDGAVIYVDPFEIEDEAHDADLILITHSHFDHFSPESIAKVAHDGTRFVAPVDMKAQIPHALLVAPGDVRMPLEGVRVEAVPAATPGRPFHPRENGWVGYVVELACGIRVYVAGDTDDLPENRGIECDIALVPVGGKYTMDPREAAAFVNALKPKVAIPEHYGTVAGSADDGKVFAGLVDPGIEVVFKL